MTDTIKIEKNDCRLCKVSNTHKNWKIGDGGCPITCTKCVNGSLFEYMEFKPLWNIWKEIK